MKTSGTMIEKTYDRERAAFSKTVAEKTGYLHAEN
jgi:hypothetical protein